MEKSCAISTSNQRQNKGTPMHDWKPLMLKFRHFQVATNVIKKSINSILCNVFKICQKLELQIEKQNNLSSVRISRIRIVGILRFPISMNSKQEKFPKLLNSTQSKTTAQIGWTNIYFFCKIYLDLRKGQTTQKSKYASPTIFGWEIYSISVGDSKV